MAVLAITYPLTLPTSPAPSRTKFELKYMTGVGTSPFSGHSQAHDWGGRLWMAEVVFPPMTRAQADAFIAFAARLRGRAGSFLMGDWDRRASRGNPGAPLVKGGSQVGNTLDVDGMGAAGTMKAGDHFALESHLYMLVVDALADGGGNATLVFEPALRSSPADNAALTTSSPKGPFRMADNSLPWDADAVGVHGLAFRATEKL